MQKHPIVIHMKPYSMQDTDVGVKSYKFRGEEFLRENELLFLSFCLQDSWQYNRYVGNRMECF